MVEILTADTGWFSTGGNLELSISPPDGELYYIESFSISSDGGGDGNFFSFVKPRITDSNVPSQLDSESDKMYEPRIEEADNSTWYTEVQEHVSSGEEFEVWSYFTSSGAQFRVQVKYRQVI